MTTAAARRGVASTIAAVATPPGRGGIGIVRVSGLGARTIATAVLGAVPSPRRATFRNFRDEQGAPIDQGIALFFPAPNSFTGEDVLELHGHGGLVVLDLLLQRLLALGARLARPGEFSERAFLNGKLDLAQAEAVADLIESGSAAAARSALRSLQGEFSRQVREIVEALIVLRTQLETAIDFAEEEIDFPANEKLINDIAVLTQNVAGLLKSARRGCLLHDGMTVVLTGSPNVGKSSLLNALARQDTAIVSKVPGTTRDLLRERIDIDGMPLHVIDTAGLRDSPDEIESEGIRRAKQAMVGADRVLLIVDDARPSSADDIDLLTHLPTGVAQTVIRNKIDLTGREAGAYRKADNIEIALSAKTGVGLDALRAHLKECMGFQNAGETAFIARRRHLDAIQRAQAHLLMGCEQLTQARAIELAAEELRQAQNALNEITGEFTSEDLLGRIFSSFCIGK